MSSSSERSLLPGQLVDCPASVARPNRSWHRPSAMGVRVSRLTHRRKEYIVLSYALARPRTFAELDQRPLSAR
jgi:hypothetical protein